MRTVRRPRRYIAAHWLTLARPLLRYSRSRDAYILRLIGGRMGPVLRSERRHGQPFEGLERRHTSTA